MFCYIHTLIYLTAFPIKQRKQAPSVSNVTLVLQNISCSCFLPPEVNTVSDYFSDFHVVRRMRQLRTFTLEGLKLQSGGQANRLQQASSPQAPVDRIRLLCSKLLPLLWENEKVVPVAWPHPTQRHTHLQMITDGVSTHACVCKKCNTCTYLHEHMQT